MLAHSRFLGQLGSFRCRGLGMSHRIPLGIGGITGFRAASAVARLNCHFWQEYCHFWQEDYLFGKIIAILPTYFAFFGDLHRKILDFTGYRGYQRVSEGFTGFRAPSRPPAIRRRATSSRLCLAGEQSLLVGTLTRNFLPRRCTRYGLRYSRNSSRVSSTIDSRGL